MKTPKFTEGQIAFVLKQAEEARRLQKCVTRLVLPRPPSTTGGSTMLG